ECCAYTHFVSTSSLSLSFSTNSSPNLKVTVSGLLSVLSLSCRRCRIVGGSHHRPYVPEADRPTIVSHAFGVICFFVVSVMVSLGVLRLARAFGSVFVSHFCACSLLSMPIRPRTSFVLARFLPAKSC